MRKAVDGKVERLARLLREFSKRFSGRRVEFSQVENVCKDADALVERGFYTRSHKLAMTYQNSEFKAAQQTHIELIFLITF